MKDRPEVNKRVGTIVLMDTHHNDYYQKYQGLSSDLPLVIEYKIGEKIDNSWILNESHVQDFYEKCINLNIRSKELFSKQVDKLFLDSIKNRLDVCINFEKYNIPEKSVSELNKNINFFNRR